LKRGLLILMLALLLSACDEQRDHDLRTWMAGVRQRHHPPALSVSPATAVHEFRYLPAARIDPFDAAKLAAHDEKQAADPLQPDLRRAREPLESFPLDSLRLIGSMRRGRDAVALIEADKLVYPLRIGGHLGQDFGKVVAIGEKTIDIEELVPESGGRWAQRRARLILQEKQ
jgi:type IV pilus assembly protein PilP